ncbi:unnamed protein product [Pneumocystis jirovecii]|uniref:Uncharacterized protein n=1 Tax=Pneumocystis jirovecii TaxID=42068 RepID=L0P8H2_PNEJI|nr:unnamed protein product [Pneumocystis jirovecii]
MQLADSTTCAGSCPKAIKRAATILAACALNPPILPAIELPTKFFEIFNSTRSSTLDLRTDLTMSFKITASAITLFPRPSIQFIAAGFLSVQ